MNIFDSSVAEISVNYSNHIPEKDRIKISGSQDVFDTCKLFWPCTDHVEYFYILLLNRQNKVLGNYLVSKGGFTGTLVDVRVIFQVALKTCATSIVAIHNHPSGSTFPSDADKSITQKIKDAGKIVDIQFLDHVIISSESYYSMADNGEV
jgi:DNA repair protein RadC